MVGSIASILAVLVTTLVARDQSHLVAQDQSQVAAFQFPAAAVSSNWFASRVVSYTPGTGAAPGHRVPEAALGEPDRMTGLAGSLETITPFQPAFMPNQIVSIGAGGSLVLELGEDATDDPLHPFGIDLIVYGNAFFADMVSPTGVPSYCATEGGEVDVSTDGLVWVNIPNCVADGPLPTMAWTDAGPYDQEPGTLPTNFLQAVDPLLTEETAFGLSYVELILAYNGGAGGTGIDLASVNMTSARLVRIRHRVGAVGSPEIDGVAVVPPQPNPFDLDQSGTVDFGDVALALLSLGEEGGPADVDGSGVVDFGDIALLMLVFG